MNQEEFTQQFGEEAWDLFEWYMDLCKSARAIAQQLEINHGVRVTGPFDQATPEHQSNTPAEQAWKRAKLMSTERERS